MRVAIIIVGFRNAADISNCLTYLDRQTHTAFTVHICENGGREAYRRLVAILPNAQGPSTKADGKAGVEPNAPSILQTTEAALPTTGLPVFLHEASGNLGYAGAINLCLRLLAPRDDWDAVWVLNPDTEPAPEALAALIEYGARGAYGIVGSRLLLKETGRVQLYGGRWRKWIARGYNIGRAAPADAVPDVEAIEREMTYVVGASMFVTRRFIETVGPMEEGYFLYNEEVDWCHRRGAFQLGYAHASVVYHQQGTAIGSHRTRAGTSPLSVYLIERNKILFTQRFYPRVFPAIALVALALTAQYMTEGAFRNFVVALRGWWAGVRGERGEPRTSFARS